KEGEPPKPGKRNDRGTNASEQVKDRSLAKNRDKAQKHQKSHRPEDRYRYIFGGSTKFQKVGNRVLLQCSHCEVPIGVNGPIENVKDSDAIWVDQSRDDHAEQQETELSNQNFVSYLSDEKASHQGNPDTGENM